MTTRRTGATLIEFLVAISILGMLLALLLPAVQAARESARRNTCKSSLRNIGLSLLNHESAHGCFPSNGWGFQWVGDPDRGSGPRQPGGWIYNILPYIERSDLAGLGAGEPTAVKRQRAAQANQVVVALFYCPTRRAPALYPFDIAWPLRNADAFTQASKTDYAINAGDRFIAAGGGPLDYKEADDPNYSWPDFSKATGVSFLRSTVKIADIRDGASHTYLVGEKHVSAGTLDLGDDQSMLVGYDLDNSRWTPSGSPPIPDSRGNAPRLFGSAHPTVCEFIMCDGSAREISFSIDPVVHRRLGNRMDGELIDDAGY